MYIPSSVIMGKITPWHTMFDMIQFRILLSLFILFSWFCQGYAQQTDIREFTANNVANGENISLLSYKDQKAVVLLFISNVCPYAQYYQGRIESMVETYEQRGIAFLLVNSHMDNDESPSSMKSMWNNWNTHIPYLADKTQELQRMFDIQKSPTAIILKPLGEGFSIYYSGKIDNNPMVESDVKEAYLEDNLVSLLADKPPAHANNRSIGCMIR